MQKIGLFLGTERGLKVLENLVDAKRNVIGVLILVQQNHEIKNYTKELINFCVKNNISFKTTKEISPKDYQEYLRKNKYDIVFVVSWRFLIPEECFSIPSYGIFVLHDSLLPKYRGFSPTNWVIINGEKETGLTLQYINKNMDAGDIVDQIHISITENETAKTLNEKFLSLYPKIILDNIDDIFLKKNKRKPQKESLATFTCKRSPEDGKIDFHQPTKKIIQLIRGLTYPYPGAFCFYKNKKIIIWDAKPIPHPSLYVGRIPGKIIKIHDEYIDVLTKNNIVRITQIGSEEKHFLPIKTVFTDISKSLQ